MSTYSNFYGKNVSSHYVDIIFLLVFSIFYSHSWNPSLYKGEFEFVEISPKRAGSEPSCKKRGSGKIREVVSKKSRDISN